MATAASSDECKVCLELMKNVRYLKCGHSFCLSCLEELERSKTIKCPVCRADTHITPGLQVKHLPKIYIAPQATANRVDINMVMSWEVDKQPNSLVIDEEAQVIYVAQLGNEKKPIQIYSFNMDNLGFLTSDKDFTLTCLAMDTKRGVLLATARQHIVSFNRKGLQTGVITCKEFRRLCDIAHYQYSDKYIVSDHGAHAIHFVDPKSNTVTKTIPAASDTDMRMIVNIACAKTKTMSLWATTDCKANKITIYDPEGLVVRLFEAKGSGHGQFDWPDGIYITKHGQLVVSDAANQRLLTVRIDRAEEKEWEVLTNTGQHNLESPRAIDITEDGLAVMAMYCNADNGPYHIDILSGFDSLH